MSKDEIEQRFIEIIIEYEKIIYKVCSFYITSSQTLPDLYQEVVCNIWQAYPKYKGEASLSTWIYRIALNTCITGLRKKGREPQCTSIEFMELEIQASESSNTNIEELYRLINQLKSIDKAIILLYLEEKSYQEIVDITGLSLSNVATRIKRAKRKLIEMSNE